MICTTCNNSKDKTEFFSQMTVCKKCSMDAFIAVKGNIRYEWRPSLDSDFASYSKGQKSYVQLKPKPKKIEMQWCGGCVKDLPKTNFHYTSEMCRPCTKTKNETEVEQRRVVRNKRQNERTKLKSTYIPLEDRTEQACRECNVTKEMEAYRFGSLYCKECVKARDRRRRANNLECYRLQDKIKDLKYGKCKKDLPKLSQLIEQLHALREEKKRSTANQTTNPPAQ